MMYEPDAESEAAIRKRYPCDVGPEKRDTSAGAGALPIGEAAWAGRLPIGNVPPMDTILEAIQSGASGDDIANLPIPESLPGRVRPT